MVNVVDVNVVERRHRLANEVVADVRHDVRLRVVLQRAHVGEVARRGNGVRKRLRDQSALPTAS